MYEYCRRDFLGAVTIFDKKIAQISFCTSFFRDLSTKLSGAAWQRGGAVFQTLSIYGNWARPQLIATTILCSGNMYPVKVPLRLSQNTQSTWV